MANNSKPKDKYVDDGHTIYNMDGVPSRPSLRRRRHDDNQENLTGKERWAAMRAAIECYLPMLVIMLVGFGMAIAFIFLWLK